MSDTWSKVKSLLGFSEECLNSGIKSLRGECKCPKYFEGRLCENTVCVNNGTRVPSARDPNVFVACRCPHPQYISGICGFSFFRFQEHLALISYSRHSYRAQLCFTSLMTAYSKFIQMKQFNFSL